MATIDTFSTAFRAERANRRPRRPRTPLLVRAGRLTARILPSLHALRTAVLSLTGLGCLTAAAWTVALPLGLAALGVSALVIEYLTSDGGR